ncbi:MAG: hypothetical protein EPN93_19220 [Spirochaetes bacterium]|nr:MAG: hypothetical protein EPN93_19220 [Spirochaetota bacterium]
MPIIGIIINLNAKKNRKMPRDPVKIYAKIGGERVIVRATSSVAEIRAVALEFRKRQISYLGICGGDGTMHHVLTHFFSVFGRKLPPVIVLKGGTMDTVSRTIGLKGKGPEILRRMIVALDKGRTIELHPRDTIMVGDRCCFIFGLGIASNFLREYYEGGDAGPVKAVRVAAKGIAAGMFGNQAGTLFSRFCAGIEVDGERVPFRDFLGILAATVDNVGIGFRPLFRAYEEPGTYHVIFAGFTPGTLVRNIFRFKSGKPLRHPRYLETVAKNMVVRAPGPIHFMMDGDLYETADTLVVEAGPQVNLVRV